MIDVTKYVKLSEGESILSSIEGDGYNLSASALERLMAVFERFIALITGTQKKVFLFTTEKRVIVISRKALFWVMEGSISVDSLAPRAINRVGYEMARSLIVFKSHYLVFGSSGFGTLIKSKQGKDAVYQSIDSIIALQEKVTQK